MTQGTKFASIAATFAIGISSLIAAAPAQASTTIQITDVNCQNGTLIGTPITAAPGDILEFTLSSSGTGNNRCDTGYIAQSLVASSASVDLNSSTGVPGLTASGSDWTFSTAGYLTTARVTLGSTIGTGTISLWTGGSHSTTWTVTITTGGGGNSAASQGPAPWLQSYGRSQNAICATGWHPSWAEWAIEKSGGWVCNRTVFWNGSAWVQNPNAVWGAMSSSETTPWAAS